MKDEQAVGKIVIEKTDKVTGKPIEGVVFEVREKDGKVLDTLTLTRMVTQRARNFLSVLTTRMELLRKISIIQWLR